MNFQTTSKNTIIASHLSQIHADYMPAIDRHLIEKTFNSKLEAK